MTAALPAPVLLLAGPSVLPGEADLVALATAHGREVAWLTPGTVLAPDVLDRVEACIPPLPHSLGATGWAALGSLPALRMMQVLTGGIDWLARFDLDGVQVATSAGVADASVAELVLALALAARRDLVRHGDALRAGAWEEDLASPGLRGSRVVVVGAGGIGRAVADLLAPFGVDLVRVARSARRDGDDRIHGVAELPSLLPAADVLVLAVPLTAETEGLVDARLLGLLPDGALVVNVGRGRLVVTDALVREVASGRLRAALDVVDPDPLPAGHPLRTLPGAIVTPHVGRNTRDVDGRQAALLVAQLRRHLVGEPLENLVREPVARPA
ncbi:NAD(P)-dependent oxidoreductase [Clavibacter sp. MX14-G9D]|uniref:NAD(P)-dependent oxidoreductase n=1 Tax=Clavibacter sp. MX14-G9D TaxID=3064656 RepID=UPI00293F2DFB|nr:NAD(P)-dependent oxidoreductase [Clavibacter sp. MX14-G9D]